MGHAQLVEKLLGWAGRWAEGGGGEEGSEAWGGPTRSVRVTGTMTVNSATPRAQCGRRFMLVPVVHAHTYLHLTTQEPGAVNGADVELKHAPAPHALAHGVPQGGLALAHGLPRLAQLRRRPLRTVQGGEGGGRGRVPGRAQG